MRKGSKHTKESIEKSRESHLGKKMSEEAKQKLSKMNSGKICGGRQFKSGAEHPNWKGRPVGYQREYLQNLRKATIEALGSKCSKCNFSDIRALQIDHIDGGGSKERKAKTFKGNFHKHVLSSFLANEKKYQLLCANCNWIKRFENYEHKKLQ